MKPPHEGSRQRSCSAPNLRRSPRHSPAVPGVPSLVEMGKQHQLIKSILSTPHNDTENSCLKVGEVGDWKGKHGRGKWVCEIFLSHMALCGWPEKLTDVHVCSCVNVNRLAEKASSTLSKANLGGWTSSKNAAVDLKLLHVLEGLLMLEACQLCSMNCLCLCFSVHALKMWLILVLENEDCCFTTEPGGAPGQSYLCIPFHKEGHTAAAAEGDGDEYCPSGQVPGTPPCKKSPGGGRRSELVLLGCGALLAAVGLGCNLLTMAQPEESIKPRWEGFFHRTGGQRRSTSPPTRRLFRRESPLKPSAPSLPERGLPSSYTLLSLSSVSDCNSTRSLLRSDSEELLVYRPASTLPVSQHQAIPTPVNPLVNTHLESFKRNPRQSLTPTHVPSAPSSSRSLRRTPSDGAIKKSCPSNNLGPLPEKTALENAGKVLSPLIPSRHTVFEG